MRWKRVGGQILLGLSCCASSLYAQGTLSGIVRDSSGAVIIGTEVIATRSDTNLEVSVTTNGEGAFDFTALPAPATYDLTARLDGFRSVRYENVQLGAGETVRYDFTLAIEPESVQVDVVDAAGRLTISSASVQEVLGTWEARELPLVDSDVLKRIKIVPGVYAEFGPVSAVSQSFAGINGFAVNTVRDGLSVTDGRLPRGVASNTLIHPELVAEMRVVVVPVDAEYGRGNGQVLVTTRSGTNAFHGSGLWNMRNSGLDANTWTNNRNVDAETGQWSPSVPDWFNQHQYSLSAGGPVVRDRTFFFALWDHQLHRSRSLVEALVLTEPARNGVFRYIDGWNNGPAGTITSRDTTAVVDFQGHPVVPLTNVNGSPYSGQGLMCFSVFGETKADGTPFLAADCPGGTAVSALAQAGTPYWDPVRPVADPTGFIPRFLELMPSANAFTGGDGLNWAVHRWVRGRASTHDDYSTFSGSDLDTGRKQFNLKIDHRFDPRNAIAFGLTVERTDGAVNLSNWPDGYSGATSRRPWVLTSQWTSTLSSRSVNELRFGITKDSSEVRQPWDSPDPSVRAAAREWWVGNATGQSAVFYPAGFSEEDSPYPGGRVNRESTPLYDVADTLGWVRGIHAFRMGGEIRWARSMGSTTGGSSVVPVVEGGPGGNPASAITGFGSAGQPGLLRANESGARTLLYFHAASVDAASQAYWVDEASDVEAGQWKSFYSTDALGHTEELGSDDERRRIQNEVALFAKDDWKILPSLTLNLGIRWEYYGTPYLDRGMTATLIDQGYGLFGASRTGRETENPFAFWRTPGDVYLSGYGPMGALECAQGASNGPGLPTSSCDPALLSTPVFVGPGTARPEAAVHPTDLDNWGPAVGFAWRAPWDGLGETVVRGGFQVTHGGSGRSWGGESAALARAPGIRFDAQTVLADVLPQTPNGYLDLTTLDPLLPVDPVVGPGGTLPVTARAQGFRAYDPNLTTPYVQNFTLSIAHRITRNATIEVRYVGTQARKLLGEIDLNRVNVFTNTELLEALDVTRAGGDAALFDQMFAGVNLARGLSNGGAPYTPVGSTNADGILQTGSIHLRRWQYSAFARGDYEYIARTLNTSNGGGPVQGLLPAPFAGVGGRLLRNGCDRMATGAATIGDVTGEVNALSDVPLRCFPENYLAANPQFGNVGASNNGIYLTNSGSSSYHALQVEFTLRPATDTDLRASYSWSKSMEVPGSNYTTPLDRRGDLRLAANHHTHDFRLNGTYRLPIGPGEIVLGDTRGLLGRLVEGWRLGWVFSAFSGSPLTITARDSLYDNGTPDAAGLWEARDGDVEWGVPGSGGVESGTVFGVESPFVQVPDPMCAPGGPLDVTDAMGYNILFRCLNGGNGAIADAASGAVLLQNARPGQRGTLGQTTFEAPGSLDFDASLAKEFQVDESRRVEVRVDATNVLNHPSPGVPILDINSPNFGLISGKYGERRFQGQLRLSF